MNPTHYPLSGPTPRVRLTAWVTIIVLLPLLMVPWSQAHQGQCSPRAPACEMTCCKDMSADNTGPASECPCQDTDQGCDCACCLHIASTMPPAVMGAPRTCLFKAPNARPSSQRGPSRTEQPPLPPPKPLHHRHPVGPAPTSVSTNHFN